MRFATTGRRWASPESQKRSTDPRKGPAGVIGRKPYFRGKEGFSRAPVERVRESPQPTFLTPLNLRQLGGCLHGRVPRP
jgi:hypothetical protein